MTKKKAAKSARKSRASRKSRAVKQGPSSDEMPIADLLKIPAPYNPRQKMDPGQFEALQESLRVFGPVQSIIVNTRTNHIVGGHQRAKAAEAIDWATFPVTLVDLSLAKEKKLNLALNRISGRFDDDLLAELLQSLDAAGEDLAITGFDDAELARLLQKTKQGETDADSVPSDVPERCCPGDLWSLGPHRLLCGDATDADTQARLFDGEQPVLCITDPPYGVEYDPNWRNEAAEKGQLAYAASRVGTVKNDDRADWGTVFALSGCSVLYHWSAPGNLSIEAGVAIIGAGYEIRNQIIWRKPHFPISRGHYTYQHEPCWYAVRKGSKAHWIGDRKQSSVWDVSLDANVPGGHSTQKPVELFTRAIGNHKGDVFEPFCGSGTCLIACEQLDRICYAMEIDPKFCDVILARWEAFTGEKAAKL